MFRNRVTRNSKLWPIVIPTLAFLLLLGFAAKPAFAQDPDFSTIDDPLNGDYELYTVDDLVVARTKPENSNTTSAVFNYILETQNFTISSQSALVADFPQCWMTSGRQPQQTRIGRFFAYSYDVMVTLLPYSATATGSDCTAPAGQPNMALHIQSTQNAANTATPFAMSAASTALAMDDFNQDGFEDLFIMSNAEVLVATAKNINDSNEGMSFGAPTALPAATYTTSYDPASGDFNGDGLVDVAWIGQDYTIHFATVCPDAVAGTVCENQAALAVVLDPANSKPTNIRVNDAGGSCFANGYPQNTVALTAGRYGVQGSDQLLTVDTVQTGTETVLGIEVPLCAYQIHQYTFDGTFNLGNKLTATLVDEPRIDVGLYVTNFYAQSARLGWLDQQEQAVIVAGGGIVGNSNLDAVTVVYVVSFAGATPQIAQTSTIGSLNSADPEPWVNGMAIGHFAAIADDPSTETAFNQQIAALTNDGTVEVYAVSNPPVDITPQLLATSKVDAGLNLNERASSEETFTSWLVSGDLQGRSARLGPPSIVSVSSHSQPSVILGAPPMHVDYVLPYVSTSTTWDVVNFSAVPDTFNSSYTMSQTGSNQSADTNRTSYTYATSQQGGGSFSLKPPYLPAISGSLKTTTENKNEQVGESYQFTQNEFTYDASTTTGFGDEIWYDVSSFYVYYYPVLGQTVCPADNGTCAPNEEQQLYVTFSGPGSSGTGPGPGATTEWYQPVHEPGNIFSYPWNETMLAQQIPDGVDLLTGPQHFYTDSSSQTQRLQWSSSAGQDQTAGTTNTHSYDKSYSLTGGKAVGKILDVNLQGNLDYNDSSSISTLNKSSSSVGASQGIAIAKPGTFLDIGEYMYRVEPYIFGRTPAAGSVDAVALTQTITTTGPLQTAFAANPLDSAAGSWWGSDASPYTQYIDIALNHPVRWSQSDPAGTQTTLNCLEASGPRYNCMTFNDPNPSDLWNSEFYWMRGLFVTVGSVDGPQRTQATAGEDVVLQARVYNYSFKDMPAGSTIQVQFYRQAIQGTTSISDSVLIDQVTVNPLPGFNSANSPNTPNWTTASTTLDTSTLGDTYQIFWVLVWAEDSGGNMIADLPGHGLSAKPGTLSAIGDAPLETVTFNAAQKTFSNNVGYLHSKFFIAPAAATSLPSANAVLSIENVQVTPSQPTPGARVIIGADIAASSADAEAVHVRLYPSEQAWRAYLEHPTMLVKPRAFDVEMLPHISAGESDRMEVPFQTNACGIQRIVITAQVGARREVATAIATFDNGPCTYYFPYIGGLP